MLKLLLAAACAALFNAAGSRFVCFVGLAVTELGSAWQPEVVEGGAEADLAVLVTAAPLEPEATAPDREP